MLTVPNYIEKKVLKVQFAVLASILVLLDSQVAWGQHEPVTKPVCSKHIGRVIAGDRYLVAGSSVCPGDRINPENGGMVEAVCYLNHQILHIKQSTIFSSSDICAVPQSNAEQRCTLVSPDKCSIVKGPGEDKDAPTVISPSIGRILNTRLTISWSAVANAKRYIVQVDGTGVNWSSVVQGSTLLPYPSSRPAMQLGNAYTVSVIADRGDSQMTANSAIANMLPNQEVQELTALIKQLQSFNLPPDELLVDLDSAYMSYDLLTEAIDQLNIRIKAGTLNPTIYRLLGDHYLEVGLLDFAEQIYAKAVTRAKRANNTDELAKAEAGLRLIENQFHAPTRTNAPQ